jgi:hypothetical protein
MTIVNHMRFLFRLLVLAGACLLSTSASASVAQLLITEVMANPSAVSDGNGEWFELFNPTTRHVELEGLLLSDDGSNSHTIASGHSLLIAPGEYFVVARNGDPLSNGGFNADYVYSNFSLGNSSDQIILSEESGESLRLDYSSGFVGAGISTELTSLPMAATNYALTDSALVYGMGDSGTPGSAGRFQPSPVPLPAAAWLFCSGLAGLVGIGRGKQRAKF